MKSAAHIREISISSMNLIVRRTILKCVERVTIAQEVTLATQERSVGITRAPENLKLLGKLLSSMITSRIMMLFLSVLGALTTKRVNVGIVFPNSIGNAQKTLTALLNLCAQHIRQKKTIVQIDPSDILSEIPSAKNENNVRNFE